MKRVGKLKPAMDIYKTPVQSKRVDWQVFTQAKSVALGLDRVRLVGNGNPQVEFGRVGIVTSIFDSQGVVFSMDKDEVRDLIDALQKYLAVVE